jgi:hypothetical protein
MMSGSPSPTTNFSVMHQTRVLRRSSIGAIFTRRSIRQSGDGSNLAYGIDGTFAFFDNLAVNTYCKQRLTALRATTSAIGRSSITATANMSN